MPCAALSRSNAGWSIASQRCQRSGALTPAHIIGRIARARAGAYWCMDPYRCLIERSRLSLDQWLEILASRLYRWKAPQSRRSQGAAAFGLRLGSAKTMAQKGDCATLVYGECPRGSKRPEPGPA